MVGYSKMVKCGCEGTTRLEGRLVGVVSIEFSCQLSYVFYENKFNDFVVNKVFDSLLQNNIFRARAILSTHTISPTYYGGN